MRARTVSSSFVLLLAALALAGCASSSGVEVPKEVMVEVPVPCVKADTRPQRPALRTQDELMALDTYRRTHAAWADLKRYEGYTRELEAVVEGCSRIPGPTDGGRPMQK